MTNNTLTKTAAPVMAASIDIRVPFYDVDSMEIVWHGHYVKYFEEARCQLLDQLDYNYQAMRSSGFAWPIVDLRIKYVKPAQFNRWIRVVASLVEWEIRLKIDYVITDLASGLVLTKGSSVQVAVDIASSELCFATPDILRHKIEHLQAQAQEQKR